MTEHSMNLHAAPFAAIRSGRKTVEMRLSDEKRQAIRVGDRILFTNRDTAECLTAVVRTLHVYADFAALYAALIPVMGAEALGYAPDETADPADMERYYAPEAIRRSGVVGIEIALVPEPV